MQPACYQIANYNVHPPPKIFLSHSIPATLTVEIILVEDATGLQIRKGFQTGDTKTLRAGGNCVHFTGLKLAKIGHIKAQLRQQNLKQTSGFRLRIDILEKHWDSNPFKLVSSCTQLPENLKESVRPPKRRAKSQTPSPNFVDDITLANSKEEEEDDEEYNVFHR